MKNLSAYGKRGKLYRYYVSVPLQQGGRRRPGDEAIRRVSADPLERLLRELVDRFLPSPSPEPLDVILRVEVHACSLHVLIPIRHLPAVGGRLDDDEHAEPDPVDPSRLRLVLPIRVRFHGGRTMIATGHRPTARPGATLVRALRRAHSMVTRDDAGTPSYMPRPTRPGSAGSSGSPSSPPTCSAPSSKAASHRSCRSPG